MINHDWFVSQSAASAATAEKDAKVIDEGAGFWTVEMDALPVGYGEWFEPSKETFPVEGWREHFEECEDTGSRFWAAKVVLPKGTKGFNPAYLVLDISTFQLSPQFPTVSSRYVIHLPASSGA
ncbi:hypothetical protein ACWGVR_27630 [Streptomyces xanthophaeus]